QHDAFHVKRQGLAQVGFLGLPNSGKSALVHALTGADTAVADYPFATQAPVPGMRSCEGGALQLVDLPPAVPGLAQGQGAGRALLHLVGTMDAVALVAGGAGEAAAQVTALLVEAEAGDLCLWPGALGTVLGPRGKGGVQFLGHEIPREDTDAARGLLAEAGIEHAEVTLRGPFDAAELAAQICYRRVVPAVIALTKSDLESAGTQAEAVRRAHPSYPLVPVSSFDEASGARLAQVLLDALGLVRVQVLVRPQPEAEGTPQLVAEASTVQDLARAAGGAPPVRARVWGPSASLPGQVVGLGHLLAGGDLVYLET
ncbi:MAG: GTPase, partial [Gemmatimonadota bacterium]